MCPYKFFLSLSRASMTARKLYAVWIIKRHLLSVNILDILLLHQYVSMNDCLQSFSCLWLASTQATCSNKSPQLSEVSDRLFYSPSVYLSKTMWAWRELINKLAGNACSHKTKATIEYHDKHSITFDAITNIVPHHLTLVCLWVGIHWRMSLIGLSLLLQQCLACLIHLTWVIYEIRGKCPYSCFFWGGAAPRICSE